MPAAPPKINGGLARFVAVAATLVELATVVIVALLLPQVLHHRNGEPSEQHAWSGMGIVAMLFLASRVVIPGTLIALVRGSRAFNRWRHGVGSIGTALSHGAVLALTALVLLLLALPARPRDPQTAAARSNIGAGSDRAPSPDVAGYVWAIDNGVGSEAECRGDTPEFVAGCRRAIREHPGR